VSNRNAVALLYLVTAIIALTLFLPEWLTIPVTEGMHRHDGYAGLWGVDTGMRGVTRWDNLRVDLDIYGFAYAAFAIGLVAVGSLVAVATGRRHLVPFARKVVRALLVAELLFVVRLLIENGVGFYVFAAIGPAAVYGALRLLPKLAQVGRNVNG
jgi:hypothetical protein